MLSLLSFSLPPFLEEVLSGSGTVYCGTFSSSLSRGLPLFLLPSVTIATGSWTRGSCVQLGAKLGGGWVGKNKSYWVVSSLLSSEKGCKKILKDMGQSPHWWVLFSSSTVHGTGSKESWYWSLQSVCEISAGAMWELACGSRLQFTGPVYLANSWDCEQSVLCACV